MLTGVGDRRGQLLPAGHPADPDRRSAARGFDESRQPKSFKLLGVRRRLRRSQHRVVADRKPLGNQQLLGELLVHSRRAGQHSGADVGHAGEFKQTLDGAVFPVRSVQDREDHVDRRRHLSPTGRQRYELAGPTRVSSQGQLGARFGTHRR